MKPISHIVFSVALSVALIAPNLVFATTVVGSNSPSGGFFGISSGNSAFGISWGSGGALCTATICGIANTILYVINAILVPVIFALAFIVFLWGVFLKYIYSHGDTEKVSEGHKLILWGLIGFVVMVSLWGLVNVIANTFGLTGYFRPELPSSY